MATKKKMGFDPLAWMNEDEEKASQSVAKKPAVKKGVAKKPAALKKEAVAKPGLNVDLLESSFAALAPKGELLVARFYAELFKRFPGVIPLFENTTPEEQQKKLLAALQLVVKSLRKPAVLKKALVSLGERHQGYGAVVDHYGAVSGTLLDVMSGIAGDLWTDEVGKAWEDALNTVAEIMLSAYQSEDAAMAATNKVNNEVEVNNGNDMLQSVLDNAMTAIMMIDRDLVITYANQSTISLLGEHEDALKSLYPNFSVGHVVGTCIDIFHSNPAHQRQLLANPANLPYSTDIVVGPLTFRINVTAMNDSNGEYVGNALEWSDVTELRAQENNSVRLQGMVDGAMTAMMMIDRDFNITYANSATLSLLKDHESSLREVFPGFSADAIVGTNIDTFHKNPDHQRKLLSDPNNLPYQTDIEVGALKFALNVTAVMDAMGNYIGNALEWSDVTEMRVKETQVARLQSAVDGAASNLMLCNENLEIVYANPAVIAMLANRETELRKIWPGLDTRNMIGQNIDQFHKRPEHQRALLSDASRLPAKAEINIGELAFEVNATMITGPDGEYMGNMVEWKDQTEEKDAERQIQALIENAVEGQLDSRIQTEQYSGFMKSLGDGINSLMDAVVEPIQETVTVIQGLADGDLTNNMSEDYQGEFKVLSDAVNGSINNLKNMVSEIHSSAGNISSAANEISQGNTDLSQRTEEQASSLEETASSMEELTGTVRQNADNARQANQLASSARTEAEGGGDVATKTSEAMNAISKSSKEIADIIGVIDEIAFQTNLLALNAAVEAARAGEQGRGFAVVAAEVRNLAQRSASAAKEIKSLIKDSVEKVDEGTRLVDESGKSLDEIVTSVKKVSDIIAEIAAASQEQSAGIEQINKAVTQMDEMTQQNAALVEEAAAASESLDEQSTDLSKLMGFFKTGENQPQVEKSMPTSVPGSQARIAVPTAKPRPSRSVSADDEWDEF
ncbi:MAG: PAS domain-containing protein [Gammaproteobacteria bacterium]|nr:PAS domain-containing protein [Gammaproteobacteria bacterium]